MWVDIKGYEGKYQISENGMVRNENGLILKPGGNTNGYLQVILTRNGKRRKHYIHRLVAKSFISNPTNKPQVNHINAIRNDNRIENLEWVTISENQVHAVNLGTKTFYRDEESPHNKSINQYSKSGKFLKKYYSIRNAAKENGLDFSSISKVCKGKRKTAGNYIWKFD